MAKITFISLNDVNADGLRYLSANLKQNGHQPYIIFLKRYNVCRENIKERKNIEEGDWVGIDESGKAFRYASGSEVTDAEKKLLFSLIGDIKPDLIGFSQTAPLKKKVIDTSRLIKSRYDIPIVWGGADPTVNARECLDYCDMVCIGEGENAIMDIARCIDDKKSMTEVKNIAYLDNGRFAQNPMYPLVSNLDELPFKDISPDNKFLIENDTLIKNFHEISYSQNQIYHTVSSRGCPFDCAYCCENYFKRLYAPQKFLRQRSPSHVIRELKEARATVGYEVVKFEDEIFSFDRGWLTEFGKLYKKEINLPLICYIYPNENSRELLKTLKDMGLFSTCLAVQSGSPRINKEIFNRPFNRESFLKTAHTLKSLKIGFYVDVITYNPFEKEEDLESTLRVLSRLPRPFGLAVNKLYVLKGTKIYDLIRNRAEKKEALISDRVFTYYSRLFWLTTRCSEGFVTFIQRVRIFKHLPFLMTCFFGLFLFIADMQRRLMRIVREPRLIYYKLLKG